MIRQRLSNAKDGMMDSIRVPTEDPKMDQWKLLAQYTYPTNILKYLESHGFTVDRSAIEFAAGCIRQGQAYFVSSENSPLDISPLLLYYGTTNLLAGAYSLTRGERPNITNHGMKLILPDHREFRIADIQIQPLHPKDGALQQFCNAFSDGCLLANGGPWTLREILGSIPDLKRDFEICYPDDLCYTIPIQMVRRRQGSLERIDPSELIKHKNPLDVFAHVEGFTQAYLPPQYSEQMDYVVLHRKIGAKEIGTYSMLGQKYLLIAHSKNGKYISPDPLMMMCMGLFALGYLSRYHPDVWNPFVRSDDTGERLVMEKFITLCQRYVPNLVLNVIYRVRVQFVYETERALDLTTSLTESDLKEMLKSIKQG